jgi:crotonobetainyl-CoA:carnitine CoA-transferase CaiB-like acyl-CoA transferase
VRSDLPPPGLGQHTDEVLQAVLGYSQEKLAALKSERIV